MKAQGFTLIELLIVIAMVGILAAVGITSYARWRATSTVMDGAQQFAQAVNRTRTGAKQANACWRIALGPANNQYQVTKFTGPVCTTTGGTSQTYSMPTGATLAVDTGFTVSSMGFNPPFGTTDTIANQFVVAWSANSSITRTVRVTGIFGKVIVR